MDLTHGQVVQTITALYPGVEFAYDGDGSSLGPVEDEGGVLLSRGLEWHGSGKPPKLSDLVAALSATEAANAIAILTAQRDALLTASDWTQLLDSPLDDAVKASWATYRQALRDWPAQSGFDPLNPPAWPTSPA